MKEERAIWAATWVEANKASVFSKKIFQLSFTGCEKQACEDQGGQDYRGPGMQVQSVWRHERGWRVSKVRKRCRQFNHSFLWRS